MIVRNVNGFVGFEIADDSPLARQIQKRDLIANAASALAAYPQYAGCHDGPEWTLIRVSRVVKTKMGQAFERGEIALARPSNDDDLRVGLDGWHAWSPANRIHTFLPKKWAEDVA